VKFAIVLILLLSISRGFAQENISDGTGYLSTMGFLGDSAYRIELLRSSPGRSLLRFTRQGQSGGKKVDFRFDLAGVATEMGLIGGDFTVTLVTPGPTTRVYGEIGGRVQEIFTCTSRFGGTVIESPALQVAACFEGERVVGDRFLPERVKLFVRKQSGYAYAGESNFSAMYEEINALQDRLGPESKRRKPGQNNP
jgi:hypothetical protein